MENANGKGIALAYLTALVSGISVFANSFGVITLDSTAYTLVKNVLVAAVLAAIALSLGSWREVLSLDRRQKLMLAFSGVVGGGVAFALFFSGLSMISGAEGSFIYRLLFVFAAIIGVFALKEKFSWNVAAGALAIIAGNFLLLGNAALTFSTGAALVLAASALWAMEYAVSKKALENLAPTTVAGARMGIGAIVLFGILVWQGKVSALGAISAESLVWIAIATGLLTLFTTLWYSALKSTSLISATAAFTLGGPISALLSLAFAGKSLAPIQAAGFLLLAAGAIFVVGAANTIATGRYLKEKALSKLRA
ncbi:MAG: EamA family transporter [Candidatus Micrarchaeia archaeon]